MISRAERSRESQRVLIDSSIWIEHFSPRQPLDLGELAPRDRIFTCLPVIQEVLQGFREDARHRPARATILSAAMVENPLRLAVFEEAVALYRRARAAGLTIRSSKDCLIAVCAIRHDLEVLHRDRDYPLIARVSPLRQREV